MGAEACKQLIAAQDEASGVHSASSGRRLRVGRAPPLTYLLLCCCSHSHTHSHTSSSTTTSITTTSHLFLYVWCPCPGTRRENLHRVSFHQGDWHFCHAIPERQDMEQCFPGNHCRTIGCGQERCHDHGSSGSEASRGSIRGAL